MYSTNGGYKNICGKFYLSWTQIDFSCHYTVQYNYLQSIYILWGTIKNLELMASWGILKPILMSSTKTERWQHMHTNKFLTTLYMHPNECVLQYMKTTGSNVNASNSTVFQAVILHKNTTDDKSHQVFSCHLWDFAFFKKTSWLTSPEWREKFSSLSQDSPNRTRPLIIEQHFLL